MKGKILVVDNNKVILRLLSYFLERQGYWVKTAEDGLLALDALETFHPDFIFIDLIMPKINGEKLCRIIRKMPEFDSTYLIIISAIAAEERVDFISFGANACIAKGPASSMQKDIVTVLSHLNNDDTSSLSNRIFGSENVFERDITKELLAAKNHFETALNNMTDGFIELTNDSKIIFANRAAARLFNLCEEGVLSRSFPTLFDHEHVHYLQEVLSKLDSSPVELGEEQPITLDGKFVMVKLVPVVENNQQFVLVLLQDISKRKAMENELREHKEQLEERVAKRTAEYQAANKKLSEALSKVKLLSGFIPICASCKKIRDDKGYWNQIESYISKHSDAEFSHGICPDCAKEFYPDFITPAIQESP